MFEIKRYTPDCADEWNRFVAMSKNGTFLFDRGYMDYHSDRFNDHSLMFYDAKGLFALLPANARDGVLYSHQGLTYGGLVTDGRATTESVCQLFREMNDNLRTVGFRQVVYKPVPWIYHSFPSEEDLYALFVVCQARLTGRDVSSVIPSTDSLAWRRDRRYAANKACRNGVVVSQNDDYHTFWHILTENLQTRYGLLPVHTLNEMLLLRERFPQHIRLYTATKDGEMLGGTVLYLCGKTMHSQYIASTPEGKHLHAVDALYERILKTDFPQESDFFDFGKSTLGYSYDLNGSLMSQKEGFGARAVCYDTYEWTL